MRPNVDTDNFPSTDRLYRGYSLLVQVDRVGQYNDTGYGLLDAVRGALLANS